MNIVSERILAQRYAKAFSDRFAPEQKAVDTLRTAEPMLKRAKSFFVSVDLLTLTAQHYQDLMETLKKIMGSIVGMQELIHLLIKHKRLALLVDVVDQIQELYAQKQREIAVTVESTHPLSSEQKNSIHHYVVHKTKSNPRIDFLINRQLIAGIRISSKFFLWEKSIDRHMRELQQLLA